jgi:HK97 family phage portal protein
METTQLQVSSSGLHVKSPVQGLGLYGTGGTAYGPAYTDRYKKQRIPTPAELVAQYRNAVYTCVRLNAEAGACVARKLYVQTRRGEPRPKCKIKGLSNQKQEYLRSQSSMSGRIAGDTDVEEVTDHRYLDLTARPNPYYDSHFLSITRSSYMDIVGNAYEYVGARDRLGVPTELWPLPAHQVWPVRVDPNAKELVDYYAFAGARTLVKIDPADIVHYRMFNPWEPYALGMSPLWALIEHVNVNEQFIGHYQALLDNQARPDAILSPEEAIGEYEQKRLETRLNTKFRAAGFGGLMVTESGMKLQPLGWSPVDLGVFEAMGINRDQIFDAYGVPQALATKDTNLANLEASLDQHARFAVRPRVINQDETINRVVMPWYDDSGRLFVASDNPIPDDEDAKVKKTVAYVQAGITLRDEARIADGQESAEWAKKPTLPTNQQVLDASGNPPAKPMPGQGAGGGANGNAGRGVAGGKPKGPKGKGALPEDHPESAAAVSADQGKPSVDECLRLAAAVRDGGLSKEAGFAILAEAYGEEVAARCLSEPGDRDLYKQLDIALQGFEDTNQHDRISDKVATLWQEKGAKIKWQKPDFGSKKTKADAERIAGELDKQGYRCSADELRDELRQGGLVPLKDKLWKRIAGTNSLDVAKLSDVMRVAHSRKRKVRRILADFLSGKVRAPIVLCFDSGDCYLFSGDTRLCLARVLDIQPSVWCVELGDEYKKTAQGVRGKEIGAAKEKLQGVPPIGPDDQIPAPFEVLTETRPTFTPEQYAEGEFKTLELASLVLANEITLHRGRVEEAIDGRLDAPEPAVLSNKGRLIIVSGAAKLAAAVLLGQKQVTLRVIEVPDESKTPGDQGPVETPAPGAQEGQGPGAGADNQAA